MVYLKVKVKVKFTLEQATKAEVGFSNLTPDGEWVVNTTPRPFYPRERPSSHYIGGWLGPGIVWMCT
jgi:hypothetical protein